MKKPVSLISAIWSYLPGEAGDLYQQLRISPLFSWNQTKASCGGVCACVCVCCHWRQRCFSIRVFRQLVIVKEHHRTDTRLKFHQFDSSTGSTDHWAKQESCAGGGWKVTHTHTHIFTHSHTHRCTVLICKMVSKSKVSSQKAASAQGSITHTNTQAAICDTVW